MRLVCKLIYKPNSMAAWLMLVLEPYAFVPTAQTLFFIQIQNDKGGLYDTISLVPK